MVRVLGAYLTRGWPQAVIAISVLTVLSLFVMPLAFVLSGAPLALVTLRRGELAGLQVIGGVALILAALSAMAGVGPYLALAYAATIWVPVWLCSIGLRRSESQAAVILIGALLATTFALGMHLAVPDVAGWWHSWLDAWLTQTLPAADAARYLHILEPVAPMLNALVAVAMMFSVILAVLLGRAWQAGLFNPGGFRREFHGLGLPRQLVLPLVAMGIAVVVVEGPALPILRDLLIIGLFAFLFHGVAAVHRTVASRGLHPAWLAGMYVLMLLLPQMVLFLACIGMVDAWFGRPGAPAGRA